MPFTLCNSSSWTVLKLSNFFEVSISTEAEFSNSTIFSLTSDACDVGLELELSYVSSL